MSRTERQLEEERRLDREALDDPPGDGRGLGHGRLGTERLESVDRGPAHHQTARHEHDRLEDQRVDDELARGTDASEDLSASAPRPRRVGTLTALLVVLLLGGLFFLAGVQAQKYLGAVEPPRLPAPNAPIAGARAGGEERVSGEIEAVAGNVVYVRRADGTTVKVRVTDAARVLRGRSVELRTVRPGETVDLSTRGSGSDELTARSLTVLPPPRGGPRGR